LQECKGLIKVNKL